MHVLFVWTNCKNCTSRLTSFIIVIIINSGKVGAQGKERAEQGIQSNNFRKRQTVSHTEL